MQFISLWCAQLEDSHFNTWAMAEEAREFETDSFVRGYQVCWMPVVGEQLACEREEGNPRDRYAVIVKKVITYIVGYVPRNILTLCLLFIRRGSTMLMDSANI